MYITRHLEKQVLEASKYYPVVMVTGQRQVGKSTMLHHIMGEDRKYVTLDNITARRLAENDPELFFETYTGPLLVDEVQRVPSLLLEIKRIVDEKALQGETMQGMFWLTGSQKFVLMQNVAESLAGRVAVFNMAGLSQAELEKYPAERFLPELPWLKERAKHSAPKTVQEVYQAIYRGSMPQIISSGINSERYYSDYVNTYLERDIKELAQVGNLSTFYDFLVYMAARTAQELVYSDIAKHLGISAPTAKSWVSILERSGIIYILRPYFNNITKRLVKTPKVYFMDSGLAAFLCRWTSPEVLEAGAMDGAFLETYAVTEIVKSYYNSGRVPDFYYYRDVDGHEIDLLFVENQKVYPVEIKKAKNPSNPGRNFGVAKKLNLQVQPGIVLCMSDQLVPYDRETYLCPIALL